MEGIIITYFQSLSAAGFAATAISYGPARMGFGLFVPEIRSAFSMSNSAVGVISSLGFLGFFIGLLIAQFLLDRKGPEVTVLSGLAAATIGMAIVAIASNTIILALGIFLAASSAGFAWTPFNDAVHRKIRDVDRPTALAEISTGTTIGIVAAGLAALGMVISGISWRFCWALFAIAGALALVANWAVLSGVERAEGGMPENGWRALLHLMALPLFAIAFVFGTTSAIFISFAADHLLSSGGMPGLSKAYTPALVFICFGIFGLAGLFTRPVKDAIGLPWLLRLLMLAGAFSVGLLAILPGSWTGLIASAGLMGVHVMMTSAILAFWSEKLFPFLPSLSFTAALLAMAAGSVVGPALAGIMSDTFGAKAMFLSAASLPTITTILLRDRHIREDPGRMKAAEPT